MNNKLYGTTFYGNEASDYAKKNGRLDYRALAKSFDAVLNNGIMEATMEIGYWEQENGFIDNSDEIEELNEKLDDLRNELENLNEDDDDFDDEYDRLEKKIDELEDKINELENETEDEIFQYFIISDEGARILKDWTNEIVFYNEALDMYVWGVAHYGTAWDYVLTDIQLNCGEGAFNW